jgi:hypothetical protein
MEPMTDSITGQAAGAFGEWAVVVELLRRGWIPANVNQTVKNADDFDILAWKGDRTIRLSVKTCRPSMRAFQIGGFVPGKEIEPLPNNDADYTVLVRMADKRTEDLFYIVPSHILREECILRQRDVSKMVKRDGGNRQDIGKWNLTLADRKDGKPEGGYGIARKWAIHLEGWQALEKHG